MNTTPSTLDSRLPNALKLAAAREVNTPELAYILLVLANNVTVFLQSGTGMAEVLSLMSEYVTFAMSQQKAPGNVPYERRDVTSYFAQILADIALGGMEKVGRGFVIAMHSSHRAELDSARVQQEMDRLGVRPGTY